MNQASFESWFNGRTALVTGAGSGMGSAIALHLGQAGAHVGVHYRSNLAGAQNIVAQIIELGGKAETLQADLAEEKQVQQLFTQLDSMFDKPIEMLVNNAGDWMDKQPIMDCTLAQWEKMFAINARSVFLCCQQAARRMTQSQLGGSIVNLGSLAGHTGGGGGTVPYAAAKAAVHTFTRGLAKELAPANIRVNALSPGMVDTPMLAGRVNESAKKTLAQSTPLGRFGEPNEIAGPMLMLLSPQGSFMTGQILDVNGGLLMR